MKKVFALPLLLSAIFTHAAEFRVADFGAKADGKTDDSAAIRAAIRAAVESRSAATVVLDAKTYRVSSESADGKKACFVLGRANNLTIQGVAGRTELVSTTPLGGMFYFNGCTNIRLAGVTIDYDPVPYIQGGITAVDAANGTFDFTTDEGYPRLTAPPPPRNQYEKTVGRWGVVFDRKTRGFKPGTPSFVTISEFTPLGDRSWRLKPARQNEIKAFAPGDAFVLRGDGSGAGVFFAGCAGGALEDTTLYASPSVGIAFVGCEGKLVVRRVTAQPKPGTTRLLAINADGIHCQMNREGPLVELCRFENMTDDGMNTYDRVRVVREVISPTELLTTYTHDLRPGDRIQVMNPHTGLVRGEATVRSVTGRQRITFDPPILGVRTSTNILKGIVSMSDHLDADVVFNLNTCGAGYVIRSNYFGNFRGRGVVLRAVNGLIENNVFENLSGPGISIANEPNWPEGPVPCDITIRGNRISNVCLDGASRNMAAISATAIGLKSGNAIPDDANHGIRNVIIENNLITRPPAMGIYLRTCENVRIANNSISENTRELPRQQVGISLNAAAGVVISNNVIAPAPRNFAAIEIQSTVPPGEAGVKIIRPAAMNFPVIDRRPKK